MGDCGVKSYLAMFKNNPETLSVFFFRDSTNMARDGRMREHVTKSFTVTGQMINLATKPMEFREKMERLGAAHGALSPPAPQGQIQSAHPPRRGRVCGRSNRCKLPHFMQRWHTDPVEAS